jgi:hypothetical protein
MDQALVLQHHSGEMGIRAVGVGGERAGDCAYARWRREKRVTDDKCARLPLGDGQARDRVPVEEKRVERRI